MTHFERGLTAKGVLPEGDATTPDAEAAALLFGLVRAKLSALERWQCQQGVDTLSRAFDYYENTGDVARAVAVAGYPLPVGLQGRTGVAQYIFRALKLVPPDSPAAARLLASYGFELGRVENDYEGAQQAFNQALSIAHRENDGALKLRTLAPAIAVAFNHLYLEDVVEKAREAIELARGLEDQHAVWSAYHEGARAHLITTGFEVAQDHASTALELADQLRDRSREEAAWRTNAHLYRHARDWQRAREFRDKSRALAPLDLLPLIDGVIIEHEAGDFGRGAAYLEQFLEALPPVASRPTGQSSMPALVIPWVARITGETDRLDLAAATAQAILSSPLSNPSYRFFCLVGLGLLAVVQNDAAGASEQYKTLQSHQPSLNAYYFSTSRDHLLGLLAQTMGQLDLAANHFEQGIVSSRKAGYRPELAWTCCDYADALLQRNEPGDREKARSLLDESWPSPAS